MKDNSSSVTITNVSDPNQYINPIKLQSKMREAYPNATKVKLLRVGDGRVYFENQTQGEIKLISALNNILENRANQKELFHLK